MRTFDNINKCLYIFDNVNNFLHITYITNGFKYSSEKIVLNIKGSLHLYIIYLYIPKTVLWGIYTNRLYTWSLDARGVQTKSKLDPPTQISQSNPRTDQLHVGDDSAVGLYSLNLKMAGQSTGLRLRN